MQLNEKMEFETDLGNFALVKEQPNATDDFWRAEGRQVKLEFARGAKAVYKQVGNFSMRRPEGCS